MGSWREALASAARTSRVLWSRTWRSPHDVAMAGVHVRCGCAEARRGGSMARHASSSASSRGPSVADANPLSWSMAMAGRRAHPHVRADTPAGREGVDRAAPPPPVRSEQGFRIYDSDDEGGDSGRRRALVRAGDAVMGAEEAGSVEALMERLVRRGRLMDAERAFRKWAFADPSHPRPPSLGPPRPSLAATRLYLRALIGAGIKGIAAHAPPHAVPWVRHNRAREAIALYADLEARRGGDPAQGVSALVEELAAQVSANLALTEDERLTLVGAAEWAMAEHGAAPSAAARVCLAECLLRAAKAAEALAWLAGAAHPSPPEWAAVRLAQVASLALAELAAQGTPLREVLAWARRMASAGVHPSPHALHALATTACDARDSNAALVATRALLASVAAFADRRGRVHVLPARASPALCESLLGVAAALGHAALAEAAWELAVRSLHVPTPPAHWRPLTLCRMPGDGGRGAESGLWERTGLPGRGAGWRPGAVLEGARRKGGAQRRLAILRAREVARAAALARLAESGWSAGAGVVEDDRRGLASEAEWGEGEQAWAHRRRINAMIARELSSAELDRAAAEMLSSGAMEGPSTHTRHGTATEGDGDVDGVDGQTDLVDPSATLYVSSLSLRRAGDAPAPVQWHVDLFHTHAMTSAQEASRDPLHASVLPRAFAPSGEVAVEPSEKPSEGQGDEQGVAGGQGDAKWDARDGGTGSVAWAEAVLAEARERELERRVRFERAVRAEMECAPGWRVRPPSAVLYHGLAHVLAWQGDLERVCWVVAALQRDYPCSPAPAPAPPVAVEGGEGGTRVTVSPAEILRRRNMEFQSWEALDAIAAAMSPRAVATEAVSQLAWLQKEGTFVPRPVLDCALVALSDSYDLEGAIRLFETMEQSFGQAPSTQSHSAIMRGCLVNGNPGAVLSIGEEMQRAGVDPDRLALEAVVQAHLARSELELAAEGLDAMLGRQMTPSTRLLTAFTLKATRLGDEGALQWVAGVLQFLQYYPSQLSAIERRWRGSAGARKPSLLGKVREFLKHAPSYPEAETSLIGRGLDEEVKLIARHDEKAAAAAASAMGAVEKDR